MQLWAMVSNKPASQTCDLQLFMASYSLKFLIKLLIYNGLGKISSIVDVPNSTFNNNNTSNDNFIEDWGTQIVPL